MTFDASLSDKIKAFAESFPDIKAGIARLEDVLNGHSYQAEPEGREMMMRLGCGEGRSVLVLGLKHPKDVPELDWWENGNTPGNRKLMDISEELTEWLRKEHSRNSAQVPYYLEKGGLFLKDAAVLAGLGIVGKNNLFMHPEWGPRIRLRSVLIEGDLSPGKPLEDFSPCETCKTYCQKACPMKAFPKGKYSRPICWERIDADKKKEKHDGTIGENGNRRMVVKYCRACELACPVGRQIKRIRRYK